MKCRFCGAEMRVDDRDFRFRGCVDIYFACDSCNASCIQEIRYNAPHRESWHLESDQEVVDYALRYERP